MHRPAPDQLTIAQDMPMMTVHQVGKKYSRSLKRSLYYGLKDIARELLLRKEQTGEGWTREGEFWAVNDVSFELKRGEALALIGPNGAGKSTLLKMLCGLIKPDTGHIRVTGRTGALIELGAGFDPILSGRENILVSAAVLGLSRAEIAEVLPKIIAFSELENFVDTPVKYYSSGMAARLSFAVASHLNPTVFLVDEVLAVGDIDFQRKCINHMLRYLAGGGALVLVSHSPYLIQSVCNRGIFIHAGRVQFLGSAIDALNCYLQKPATRELAVRDASITADLAPEKASSRRPWRELSPEKPVAIDEVMIEGSNGQAIATGEDARVSVKFRSLGEREISWGFTITTSDQWVSITGSADFTPLKVGDGEHAVSCVIPKLPLLTGAYMLKIALMESSSRQPVALFGWEDAALAFQVQSPPTFLNNALKSINQLMTVEVVWEKPVASTSAPFTQRVQVVAEKPMNDGTIESAIACALDFLQKHQEPSGEFGFYRIWADTQPRKHPDRLPFADALISTCLTFCDAPVAKEMIDRACVSMRRQMEPFGVYRYWPPPNPDCVMVVPDVDDTAVICSALRRHGVKLPNNRGIILANRNAEGLFYTWIIARRVRTLNLGYWWTVSEKWRNPYGPTQMWQSEANPSDIDAVINSSVLSYLGNGPEMKPVINFLIEIFKEGREEKRDKWYQNKFTYYHALALNYWEGVAEFGAIREEMIARIVAASAPDGKIGTSAIDTAQAACALMNLGSDVPQLASAIEYLVRTQGGLGQWPFAPYYYAGYSQKMAWGSEELTTAFCLQTLCRYAKR